MAMVEPITGGREGPPRASFVISVARALGDNILHDDVVCFELWSALANVIWMHDRSEDVAYSFRAAGDLIAELRGEGDYRDWYCRGWPGVVSDRISDAMKAEGWTWRPWTDDDFGGSGCLPPRTRGAVDYTVVAGE